MPHATCHACGARRPLTDMQRTYSAGQELWWCHPSWQADTCYDKHGLATNTPTPRHHHVDTDDDGSAPLAPPDFDG